MMEQRTGEEKEKNETGDRFAKSKHGRLLQIRERTGDIY